ncbi:MAG TPA: NADH-quinone oxidoreductase subunit L [Kineosporiaceae bacterium]
MTAAAAILTVVLPAVSAALGLLLARSRAAAREWAVLGSLAMLVAAVVELYGVLAHGSLARIGFLGHVDLGQGAIDLDLRADTLSASVSVAVALVAACVQLYSTAYLHGPGTADAPTRYRPYAATVSLFTAAMMLVVHADDLILLLVGWEIMGICSYLLVGHHSERTSARAAAVKAFLVTRVGDLGVLMAVVVLLTQVRTTSISWLLAHLDVLGSGVTTAVAVLLLAGVAGKSAQFPLHTWLPDAMEGPTPVSALIHAATMVAAGVYLVARLMPLFVASDGGLAVAAVIASITMLGAALAALAQDDLKRLLAWSTISQVAFMLAGVAVGQQIGQPGPGVMHLLSHAAFKALLFLVAGCVTHVVGSTLFADMGGMRRTHPALMLLFGLGLAALAGIPPFSGFWSKEAVLTAAEDAAAAGVWPARMVLTAGLLTTLVTGVYAGRAYSLVALGAAPPAARPGTVGAAAADPRTAPQAQEGEPADVHDPAAHALPWAMTLPLWVLAVPTAGFGLVLLDPPQVLQHVHVAFWTAFTGTLLSLAGVGWALTAPGLGARDVADALPSAVRAFLCAGYRLDGVQDALVVRPYQALARAVAAGDRDGVDAVPRGSVRLVTWSGRVLRRAETGLVTGYVTWIVLGAIVVGLAGVVLS